MWQMYNQSLVARRQRFQKKKRKKKQKHLVRTRMFSVAAKLTDVLKHIPLV